MATNKTNWWKVGVVAVILISVYYLGCRNGEKSFTKKASKIDTVISRDTVFISTIPVEDSTKEDSIVYMTHTEHDTLEIEGEPYPVYIDTSHFPTEIVQDYYTTKYYSVDTGGVKVEEATYKNDLVKRDITIKRSDTSITKKEIYEAPKSIVLSFNVAAIGNAKTPWHAQGAEINLQLPKGGTYGAGIYNVPGRDPMFSIRKGWTIKFGKKSKWLPIPTVTRDTTIRTSAINIKK